MDAAGVVRAAVVIAAAEVAPVGVGVTEVGLRVHVESTGAPEQVSATESVKLFNPTTVTVTFEGDPAATVAVVGETAIVKSGVVVVPVPVRTAVCGLLGSLSATLKVALAAPAAVGLKVTLMAQFAPAANVVPQVVVCAKDAADVPVILTATLLAVVVPLLVNVKVCAVLAWPMAWLPKEPVVGDKKTALGGAVPVPARVTVCGLLESVSATLRVAVSAAVVDGVKMTPMVQVLPMAMVPLQVELL